MKLSLLMVSKGEPHAWPFVVALQQAARDIAGCEAVICADGPEAVRTLANLSFPVHVLPESRGFIEDNLDEAVGYCNGAQVLRIDDDETLSPALIGWLASEAYKEQPIWRFPRVHFWGDTETVLVTQALYPDWQIRLTSKEQAGGREKRPHSSSPFGIGAPAPVVLEHHKFLVKTRSERAAVAARYEAAGPGLGTTGNFKVFSLPEDVYAGHEVLLASYWPSHGVRGAADWRPEWQRTSTLS